MPTKQSGKSSTGVNAFRKALAGLALSDQKSLFDSMAPAMRLALWQDRLQSAEKELTARKQKAVLRDLRKRLSVELYSDSNRAARKEFDTYWEAAQEKAYEAFKPRPASLDAIIGKLGAANAAKPVQGGGLPTCTCSTDRNGMLHSNDCGALSKACQSGSCVRTAFGCGVMWLQACDGLCTGTALRRVRKASAGRARKS